MRKSDNNPSSNSLGSGVSENDVVSAVQSSGYPLQIDVANMLQRYFSVSHEWAYKDSDSPTIRTIDLACEAFLYDRPKIQTRTRPALKIFVECKKSELPYIFFLTNLTAHIPNFPSIFGLSKDNIAITSDDDPSSWHLSVNDLLGANTLPFVEKHTDLCMTFSKCVRKGKNLELSGSDAFNGIVLPMIKTLDHFKNIVEPPTTAVYFDCYLTLAVAVLDAPMVGVRVVNESNEQELIPWVRVLRHHGHSEEEFQPRENIYVIDVVHKDFLDSYISNYVLPFAKKVASLALKHDVVLAESRGFIAGMGQDPFTNLEGRLQPPTIPHTVKRYKSLGKNILEKLKNMKGGL